MFFRVGLEQLVLRESDMRADQSPSGATTVRACTHVQTPPPEISFT